MCVRVSHFLPLAARLVGELAASSIVLLYQKYVDLDGRNKPLG